MTDPSRKVWRRVGAVTAIIALAISVLTGCALGRSSSKTDGKTDAGSSSCVPPGGKAPRSGGNKYIVYMSSLNIGNAWQEEAENLGLAEAKMAPYNKCVIVKKNPTTADPQSEISQIQSEVAAGADAIVNYAVSPTAVNAAYKAACNQGVTVVVYDATVTEPCVYNVSYLTSVPEGSTHPFMGYNSMEILAQLLHGHGNIFDVHGVVGTSTDNIHQESLRAALAQYPGIHILTSYVGNWNSATAYAGTAKALASFPNVQGIWCGYGDTGCVKALKAVNKRIPVSGETENYFRLQLLAGWPGVSIGSPPAQGGIGMKVALAVLLGGPKGVPLDIEVPYHIVTAKNVKICPGNTYTSGCNVFPAGKVGDEDTADIFNPMLPESTLSASQTGNPVTGAVATPYTATYLQQFEQPASRRYVTRGTCPSGWKPGRLPEGVEGCIKSS